MYKVHIYSIFNFNLFVEKCESHLIFIINEVTNIKIQL